MGYNPPLDSVGSFKVVLNAYDSSYGRSAGAAVDISLKSGTNKVHGDLYYFARKPFLDTNLWSTDYSLATYFQNPVGMAPLNVKHNRDQFGAELDGPVSIPHLYHGKDKTFFLLQWEQSYESTPGSSPTISSLPNPAWLTGNFAGATYYDSTTHTTMPLTIYDPLSPQVSFVDIDGKTKLSRTPFPGNIIPQTCTPIPPATACSHLDPVGVAIAQYYLGVPTNFNPGVGYAPYQNNLYHIQVQTFVTRNGTVKLDQNFGAHDRATLRWGGMKPIMSRIRIVSRAPIRAIRSLRRFNPPSCSLRWKRSILFRPILSSTTRRSCPRTNRVWLSDREEIFSVRSAFPST